MILNKEKSIALIGKTINIKDVNSKGETIIVKRKVINAQGSKIGRNSSWGVVLDKPLNDGVTIIDFQCL